MCVIDEDISLSLTITFFACFRADAPIVFVCQKLDDFRQRSVALDSSFDRVFSTRLLDREYMA